MARVTAKQYFLLFSATLGSLFAGSSAMHAVLKPDLTIPDLSDNTSKPPKKNE
ncbi:hypothetical protein F441_03972 [Phytophthora nicotianae CJ01A1]|uniref:Uncharacterized protein n=6 Tax=Phytophthora nicotianae TaxID=4792 RepID=W2QIW5_PHYN3|nr:hypothetical protein PPTG_08037 [Phytophthora nicotianae INRA-310]ETI53017.1 hypothetical protein F443_03986 [Phytophthora nicotianae P1569]ETK92866.1 hypothetical protein L915_03875 [Phytophthora nicotianae]ETO81709.1 hypothetical protein F444_04047 [Phytophthora nicotianae P1976]ETP22814.1 hypothetical protein F441_03972 [Phytophthora nicotianae CJ01A1]ETP50808.1 hypothetical protein F442_03972 [Phytophthora nicotianae P10297]